MHSVIADFSRVLLANTPMEVPSYLLKKKKKKKRQAVPSSYKQLTLPVQRVRRHVPVHT